jgi:hypothetical protein
MTPESLSYEVGDELEYEDLGGGRRIARVTAKSHDIKKARPGFDCVGNNGEEWWGYEYQIIRVVKRPQVN